MKMGCVKQGREAGSTLIEALIGTLLMSIVFVGSTSVLSRTLVSQRYMNSQNIALLEMRENLLTEGFATVCGNGAGTLAVANYQLSLAAPACTSPELANVGVAGLLETLPASSVPATAMTWESNGDDQSQALIGGNGVLRLSF